MEEPDKKLALKKRSYLLTIKTLAPVHVGSGQVATRNFDFYQAGNQFHFLDQEALITKIIENSYPGHNLTMDFERLLADRSKPNLTTWLKKSKLLSDATIKRTLSGVPKNTAQLELLIRDGNDHAYIPGSSLKGALSYLPAIDELVNNSKYQQKLTDLLASYQNSTSDEAKQKLNGLNSCLRTKLKQHLAYFSISDSSIVADSDLMVAPLANTSISGKGSSKQTNLYEFIKPGVRIDFKLDFYSLHGQSLTEILPGLKVSQQKYFDYYLKPFKDVNYLGKKALLNNETFFLGNNTGFGTKTLYRLLVPNAETNLELVKNFLHSNFENHGHLNDHEVSPHIIHLTKWENQYYLTGLCTIDKVEKLQ